MKDIISKIKKEYFKAYSGLITDEQIQSSFEWLELNVISEAYKAGQEDALNKYRIKLLGDIEEINGIELKDWPGVENGIYISKDKIIKLIKEWTPNL